MPPSRLRYHRYKVCGGTGSRGAAQVRAGVGETGSGENGVTCSACQGEVPEGSRFCPHCGAGQVLACVACGVANAPHHRFCVGCGLGLGGAPGPATVSAAAPPLAPQAERRQITVLFCDMVDSTALAGALDPEDYREVVRAYQAAAGAVVDRFGGHVAQFLGDGLMVYFGYPRAQEDAAERALRAALGVLESLPVLNRNLGLPPARPLQVRIGVHTGVVVVGDVGAGERKEILALGDVPSIAARLQGVAPPDGIVVSGATRQLVRASLGWVDLGALTIKGVDHPVPAHALSAADVLADEGGSARRSGGSRTPIVGRDSEIGFLDSAWSSVRSGQGSVVLISGEPGIGKSRLLATVREHVRQRGGRSVLMGCSSFHTASEWHPVTEWLARVLGFAAGDGPAARFAKLEAELQRAGQTPPDDVALVAELLGLPLPAGRAAPRLTPVMAKQRTESALVHWLVAQSTVEPLCIAVEDLHWADPSTLSLVAALAAALGHARVMLLVTFRPEFTPDWPVSSRNIRLVLERLSPDGTRAIVDRLTGGRQLPAAVMEQIIANTDGVPLFVEEFTRSALESGALVDEGDHFALRSDLQPGLIPHSLRDSLAARLDRLGAGRTVARHAAVIGRRFDGQLVRALTPQPGVAVERGLHELVQAGLAYRVDLQGASDRYEFKHALIQAAAYESLLRRERIALHARVAAELDAHFPDIVDRQPELVAYHLSESHQWPAAAQRWLAAGQRSLARSANAEAVAHLSAGLAIAEHLPDEARAPLTLALLSTIGPALIATTGFGSKQVGQVYAQAGALGETLGERPEFFPALWGSWVFNLVSGQLARSREIAERMVRLGQRTDSHDMSVEGHWTCGDTLYWMGELTEADGHLASALAHYRPEAHGSHALLYGQDPGVAAACYRSLSLWALGRADASLQALGLADELAAARDHIFTTGWAMAFRFMVHMHRRDVLAALSAAEAALAFCTEHGHAFWIASAVIVRGWARAQLHEPQAGLTEMREGMAHYEATGSQVVQALWHSLLAELLLARGDLAEAREAIDTGLAKAAATGERLSEIELWRLQGQWHARQFPPAVDQAHESFGRALAGAQAAGAFWYGLRAATAQHRLLSAEGRQAHSALPDWMSRLSEGLDTPDAQRARAALAEGDTGALPPDPGLG